MRSQEIRQEYMLQMGKLSLKAKSQRVAEAKSIPTLCTALAGAAPRPLGLARFVLDAHHTSYCAQSVNQFVRNCLPVFGLHSLSCCTV